MSLRHDIIPYIDTNGYVAAQLLPPGTERGGDNGTCFTSEYYIMEHKNPLTTEEEKYFNAQGWETLIRACMPVPGLTVRFPGDRALDAPDNIIAILAASKVLSRPQVALDILNYGKAHFGFYYPTDDHTNWSGFQWRQIQLVFAMLTASGTYRWWKPWHLLASVYAALTIAVSCVGVNTGDTDPRRLSWLLIQATKDDSALCRLAAKYWHQRLYKDYKVSENAMREVAKIYYKDSHPFEKFWID